MIVKGSLCVFTIPWNQSHLSSRLQPVRNHFCPSLMSGSIRNYFSWSRGSRPFEKKTFLFIFRDTTPIHLGPCLPILWILARLEAFLTIWKCLPGSNHFWLFWGFSAHLEPFQPIIDYSSLSLPHPVHWKGLDWLKNLKGNMLEDTYAFCAVVFLALPQDLLSRQLGEAICTCFTEKKD